MLNGKVAKELLDRALIGLMCHPICLVKKYFSCKGCIMRNGEEQGCEQLCSGLLKKHPFKHEIRAGIIMSMKSQDYL